MAVDKSKQMGRPSLYKAEYCELLIEHMKQGLSFEAFGAVVHVGRRTLHDWVKRFPDFAEAKEIGESHGRIVWEKMGQILTARKGGDAAIWIFTMRNRFGWRNDPQEALEEKPGDVSQLTDEELDAQLTEKLERLGLKR